MVDGRPPFKNADPCSHRGPNGTEFRADRCDLQGGVRVTFPTYRELTDLDKMLDAADFAAWHRNCIWDQLNGFSGYDCIKFMEVQ